MAKVLESPAVPPFCVSDHRTLAQRWEKWIKSLDYYIRASGVTDQKQKSAILFHLAGPDVQEIFETLPNTGDDYKTALEKLNEYFQPKKNIPFERHVFRQAFQQPDESMDAFVTRLRVLSKNCNFSELADEAIRDQAIDKRSSLELRRRVLRESDINLQNLLIISRAFQQSNFQAREMEQHSTQSGSINALQTRQTIQSSERPEKSSSESLPFDPSVNRDKRQQQGERRSQLLWKYRPSCERCSLPSKWQNMLELWQSRSFFHRVSQSS